MHPDVILLSSGIAVAVVALGSWLLAGPGATTTASRRYPPAPSDLLAGIAAALVLFLLTLPSSPPFAKGGQLGIGVLLGAASGLLVAWGIARGLSASPMATAGALGAALAPVAVSVLAFRGEPSFALSGVLLGQGSVLLFLEAAVRDADDGFATGVVSWFLGAATAAAAGVGLAITRYEDFVAADRLAVGTKLWWGFPAIVLGAVLLGALVAGLVGRRPWVRALVGLVVSGGVLALFAARFPRYWPFLLPPLVGYVTGSLMAALSAARRGDATDEPGSESPSLTPLLGAFLLVLLLVVAYRLELGLGIALAALGFAGSAVALATGSDGTSAPSHSSLITHHSSLIALSLAAMFRLFYAWHDLESTSIYLTAHYALIGMLIGSMLPFSLGVMAHAGTAVGRRPSVVGRPIGPVAVVVVLPFVMLLLWGLKSGAGLVLGMVVGQIFLVLLLLLEGGASGSATARAARAAPVAPVILLAVATAALIEPLVPFTQELTRLQRAIAVLAALALVPLWSLWAYRGRRLDG